MFTKSQFDTLIGERSLEWRNLCEIESYKMRFLDKKFDLDIVLEAYHIIDMLGEGLFKERKLAYILKLDNNTTMYQLFEKHKLREENIRQTQYTPAKVSNPHQ